METFDLCEKCSVFIYGAGALGQRVYDQIRKTYTVQGFIDKRAVKVCHVQDGIIPTYQISELPEALYQHVVIVCVHNAVWHYEIAETLFRKGFSKILFLAMHNNYNKAISRKMNTAYSLFMEGDYRCLRELPCYENLADKIFSENIIRESANYVVALCRRELIYAFSSTVSDIESHNAHNARQEHKIYDNCPLCVLDPYISLMNYFVYAENRPDLYISLMKDMNNSFDMSESEFMEEQWKIYDLLEQEYEQGMESIQLSPIDVIWNKKGYFNILDGHHRAAFYYVKGMHDFPIRMRKEDYECWVNLSKVDAVKKALETCIPRMPIMHSYFSDVEYTIHEYEKMFVEMILGYIYRNNKEYETVLDVSNYAGEFARCIYRTGKAKKIVTLVERHQYNLQRALNDLYYISENDIVLKASFIEDLSENFQCAIICARYNTNELMQAVNFINNHVLEEIIWSSKEGIEEEKEYILTNTNYKKYQILGRKCINGRLCEIGVFARDV